MIKNSPQTLVRVGRYDKGLDDAVRGFRERLEPISFGLGNTVKYAFYQEGDSPYFLMVSQQLDRIVTPAGYNVILTVTSYAPSRNRDITEQFERETGISLNVTVPEQLKKNIWMCDATFLEFGKNPRASMNFLKGN